jgi:hypothetical protein
VTIATFPLSSPIALLLVLPMSRIGRGRLME